MMWRDLNRSRWPGRSLLRELEELQREVNRLMGDGSWRSGGNFPSMNVWAGEDSLLVTAELPGLEPDDIEISIDGDSLTLQGSRSAPELGEDERHLRRERTHGRFNRTLQMPFRADSNKVEASFGNGVLQIVVPRAEADKPRTIKVNAS